MPPAARASQREWRGQTVRIVAARDQTHVDPLPAAERMRRLGLELRLPIGELLEDRARPTRRILGVGYVQRVHDAPRAAQRDAEHRRAQTGRPDGVRALGDDHRRRGDVARADAFHQPLGAFLLTHRGFVTDDAG